MLVSMYRKVKENSRPRVYVYSPVLSIFAFPYCDMDKEIIMEVSELLIKVIVT